MRARLERISAQLHIAIGELRDYRKGAPRAVIRTIDTLDKVADAIEGEIAALGEPHPHLRGAHQGRDPADGD